MNNKNTFNWYNLKDYEIVYIERSTIKELINVGAKKAGSLSKLGIKLNSMQIYNLLKNYEGISVKILKRLLDYLGLGYSIINNKILEIRKGFKTSIKNPKFPIDLSDSRIGYLLGHLASDGCLYYDKSRKNFIRTKYCSDDQEGINLFMQTLNEVFGIVHFNQESIRNCIQIRIGNGIVGEALRKAGAVVGKKYVINENIPKIVKNGNKEIKRQYLKAIFDDEGCVGRNNFPYLTLSRNIHVNFDDKEKEILKNFVVALMKTNYFPTGHTTGRIQIRRLKEVLTNLNQIELLNKILNSKPKILVDESKLLENDFGIENKIYVMSLQLTTNGNFSIQSCMVIQHKKSVVKFYKEVGFSFTKKQNRLKENLINKRWLKSDLEVIQHLNKEKGNI